MGAFFLNYYRATASAIQKERVITPASEWLVDNFYIVEEHTSGNPRTIFLPGYYRKLPKLASGHLEGFPRVFGVALGIRCGIPIVNLNRSLLRRFVMAYQRLQPLTIGELWALAITLRVVLVENLPQRWRK